MNETLSRTELINKYGTQSYECLTGTIQTGFIHEGKQISVIRITRDEFRVTVRN